VNINPKSVGVHLPYPGRHVNPDDESTPISRAADSARHMIAATWRRIVGSPAPATVDGRATIPGPDTQEN
jgi:hypothetical protein